jgi:hypothetical protein
LSSSAYPGIPNAGSGHVLMNEIVIVQYAVMNSLRNWPITGIDVTAELTEVQAD